MEELVLFLTFFFYSYRFLYTYLNYKSIPYHIGSVKVQIGNYISIASKENGLPITKIHLDDLKTLQNELRAKFIIGSKSDDGIIFAITNLNNENLVEIEGKSGSRVDLINKLSEVSEYIVSKHEKTIELIKGHEINQLKILEQEYKFNILQVDNRINYIENVQIPEIEIKIKTYTDDSAAEDEYFRATLLIKNRETTEEIKYQISMLENEKDFLINTLIPSIDEKTKHLIDGSLIKIENKINTINNNQLPFTNQKIEQIKKIILAEESNLRLISEDNNLLKRKSYKITFT